jgi:hypothetical protein
LDPHQPFNAESTLTVCLTPPGEGSIAQRVIPPESAFTSRILWVKRRRNNTTCTLSALTLFCHRGSAKGLHFHHNAELDYGQ